MPSLNRPKARPALDWQTAHERLARAAVVGARADAEESARTLEARARALARKPMALTTLRADNAPESALELLQFHWGRERYAIEARYVHQVIVPCELTRLPGTPAHLRGVMNLRGDILPVFDLRGWFDVERAAMSDRTRWLVLGVAGPELCLWVDEVAELYFVLPFELGTPERDARASQALVRGVTTSGHTVLEGGRLLEHPDLFAGDESAPAQESRT